MTGMGTVQVVVQRISFPTSTFAATTSSPLTAHLFPGFAMSIVKEFKEFALRGNMVDLAVGIVIGGAFSGLVKSLVDDVMMPPLGLLIGGVDFSNIGFTLRAATVDAPAVVLRIGAFVNTLLTFTIMAFAVFIVVRAMNHLATRTGVVPKA
ncbi:MAG: large-conductance mechanosensitive channel protein MscL [Gemmatimonadota bacterium]